MSAPASTIPAVRDWLVTNFSSATSSFTEQPVEVYASVPTHQSEADLVIIGGARRTTDRLAVIGSMGAGARSETYHLEFTVSCTVWGSAPWPAVDDRAFAVLDACEQVVRNDPTLGGHVLVAELVEVASEHDVTEAGGGALCELTATLKVFANL